MASIGLINLGILPLLLEAMTPAYAQHDQHEQDSRRQQQEQEPKAKKNQSSRPERERKLQGEARSQRQSRSERPDRQDNPPPRREARPEGQPRQDRATHWESQRRPEPKPERQPPPARRAGAGQPPSAHVPRPTPHTPQTHQGQHQSAWPARRARDWKTEHRTWQDRGGYRGYRIPDAHFRSSFGPSHGFRMHRFPLIVVGGFPRFQFNGLWFSVMDPWPEYWSEDWYGDDDLYIEYWGDGYYLLNQRHPMDRIAITVLVG